ncbi:hypothetical protein [Robertkochia solimangrovi]|uniref:hypothetical protein n=1 Tax=Robertkochia solimangrovi TaxID=2213046 RepID=UPI0013A59413|nr:hypothetical protein [Robertkochia solimangrovi]TRZ43971.1 hypothetical protein DMZ48_08425 [Robertkochia solimangrovi]
MRWDMMNSLRENYTLTGMSKPEILQLLGKPDSAIKSEFRYFLGHTRFGINTGSLTLKFDDADKVVTINVYQG